MKKRFLHLFSLMLAVLMLIPCVGSAEEAEAVDNGVMREGLTALEATRLMGNGINLGNTLEACDNNVGIKTNTPLSYETHWGQPKTTQAMIDGMKAAGFDTIRIPVAWMTNATHLYEGDYTIDADYMDRVEEVVRYARKAGMYVIINDHWDGGWYGMFGSESAETRALAMEAYKGMWQQIAERFRDYSDYLIFESANEELGGRFDENSPLYCSDSVVTYLTDDERYALTNEINQTFVDVVRATGGNNATRFLLIAGYSTDINQTCDDRFQMPKDTADSKLMVSVHYYDPWSYCGASSAASATKWGKVSDYEYMDQQLAKMTKFTEAGYGVVIGEYGALPSKVNEEVRKKAIGDEDVITCRPADLLAPELDKYREEIKDKMRQEEDVLSYALFPQVALKFFEARAKAEEPSAPAARASTPAKPEKDTPECVTTLYVEDLTI